MKDKNNILQTLNLKQLHLGGILAMCATILMSLFIASFYQENVYASEDVYDLHCFKCSDENNFPGSCTTSCTSATIETNDILLLTVDVLGTTTIPITGVGAYVHYPKEKIYIEDSYLDFPFPSNIESIFDHLFYQNSVLGRVRIIASVSNPDDSIIRTRRIGEVKMLVKAAGSISLSFEIPEPGDTDHEQSQFTTELSGSINLASSSDVISFTASGEDLCGDDNIDTPPEDCDGTKLTLSLCNEYDSEYTSGNLSCWGMADVNDIDGISEDQICTYNTSGCVLSSCGDEDCNGTETFDTCPEDCTEPDCNNDGTCQFPDEDPITCPDDCCKKDLSCDTECKGDGYRYNDGLTDLCYNDASCETMCSGSASCGDGHTDEGEECDDGINGNQQDSVTCDKNCTFALCGDGYDNTKAEVCDSGLSNTHYDSRGTITTAFCNMDCTDDAFYCGDGDVQDEYSEECDGSNLNGSTCQTFDYAIGTLACNKCRYDKTDCLTDSCGGDDECTNGETESSCPEDCTDHCINGEQDSDEGGVDCGGTDCDTACPVCGDGNAEGTEECDISDFKGRSCITEEYLSGTLTCTDECAFDVSGCEIDPECGNGDPDDGEECEPGDTEACNIYQFQSGTVTCTNTCSWDENACVPLDTCNDSGYGQIDSGEECDGTNLNGRTCILEQYDSGTLSCNNQCQFDTSDCNVDPECGDGNPDEGEQCEGEDTRFCDTGFTGTVTCNNENCTWNESSCVPNEDCGNDEVDDPSEECDGPDLNNATCVSEDFASGALSCTTQCLFDTSACVPITGCGDGEPDDGEECEPGDIDQCSDHYFLSGTVTCNDACTWDTSECNPFISCGNDEVDDPSEECDGPDLNNATCVSEEYEPGILGCTDQCLFNFNECDIDPDCGNGTPNTGEQCDGNSAECSDYDFLSGTMTCNENCTWNDTACIPNEDCGNGDIDAGEDCDSDDLNGRTCFSKGFAGGDLACNNNQCTFNTNNCDPIITCGNGNPDDEGEECDGNTALCPEGQTGYVTCNSCLWNFEACIPDEDCGNTAINIHEDCDGTNLNNTTCEDLFFESGDLSCNYQCNFDTGGCVPTPNCGNGVINEGEFCDVGKINTTCEDEEFMSGVMQCSDSCQLNTNLCIPFPTCPNGEIDEGEDCESTLPLNDTCESLDFDGGTLSCASDCTYNTDICWDEDNCGNSICDINEAICHQKAVYCEENDIIICPEDCDEPSNHCSNTIRDGDEEGIDCGGTDCGICVFECTEEICETCGVGLANLCDLEECSGLSGSCQYYKGRNCTCATSACGNGDIDDGEECDGLNLGNRSCLSEEFASGTLSCNTFCQFDTSACVPNIGCGNDTVDNNEDCDDNTADCTTLGFTSGTATCNNSCSWDKSGCVLEGCLNGKINGNEECDQDKLDGKTCELLEYASGTLSCSNQCTFDTSACVPNIGCGNGSVDPGEQCDGISKLCPDGIDGVNTCMDNCLWDPTDCQVVPHCGDGDMNTDEEECDDGNDNSDTAVNSCRMDCTLFTCGDLVQDEGEECDDGTDNSDLDADACRTDCKLPICGDNAIDTDEECDLDNLDSKVCSDFLGFNGGDLDCNISCEFTTASCSDIEHCINGVQDASEDGIDCGGGCVTCGSATAHCTNDTMDEDETGEDCGGADCVACSSSDHCTNNSIDEDEDGIDCGGVDCGACSVLNHCTNGTMDQGETGRDCGGADCNKCRKRKDNHCTNGIQNTTEDGIDCGGRDCPSCDADHCFDDVMNDDEEGIDCGGVSCLECAVDHCTDGTLNEDEVGIDCGGPTCATCHGADHCSDGIQNPDESGIDCGGTDCGSCKSSLKLHCTDGVMNNDEGGIDCGGLDCHLCDDTGENITDRDVNEEAENALDSSPTETDHFEITLTDKECSEDVNDVDEDGLSAGTECYIGTDPTKWDTDEDGCSDGEEVNQFYSNPLDNTDCDADMKKKSQITITDPKPGWIVTDIQVTGITPLSTISVGVIAFPSEYRIIETILKSIQDNQNVNTEDLTAFLSDYEKYEDYGYDDTYLEEILLKLQVGNNLPELKPQLTEILNSKVNLGVTDDIRDLSSGDDILKEFRLNPNDEISSKIISSKLYDLVAVANLKDGSILHSTPIRFSLNSEALRGPIPYTIGGKSIPPGAISMQNLFIDGAIADGDEILIQDSRPLVTGLSEYGVHTYAIWNSVVLMSSIISDSEEGSFAIQAPKNLKKDISHKITLYSVKTDGDNKLRSENVNVFFRIKDAGAGSLFWKIFFIIIIILILGLVGYMAYKKKKESMKHQEHTQDILDEAEEAYRASRGDDL